MSKARQRRESKQAEQAKKKGLPTRAQIERLMFMGPEALAENPTLLHTLMARDAGPLHAHQDDDFLAKEFESFKGQFELLAAMRADLFLADRYPGADLPPQLFVWDDEAADYQHLALPQGMGVFKQGDYGVEEWFEELQDQYGAKAAFLVLPFFTLLPALAVCCFTASGARWVKVLIGKKWAPRSPIAVVDEYLQTPSPQSLFVESSERLEEMHEDLFWGLEEFARSARTKSSSAGTAEVDPFAVSETAEGLAGAAMQLWMEPCLRLGAIAAIRDEKIQMLQKQSAIDLEQLEKQAALLKKAQAEIEALKESNRHARDRELGYQRALLGGQATAQTSVASKASTLPDRLNAFF